MCGVKCKLEKANRTCEWGTPLGSIGREEKRGRRLLNLSFMCVKRSRSKLSRVAAWVFATMLLVMANATATWIGLFGRVVCRLPPLPGSKPQIVPSLPRSTHEYSSDLNRGSSALPPLSVPPFATQTWLAT
jgi:hypothetical protein